MHISTKYTCEHLMAECTGYVTIKKVGGEAIEIPIDEEVPRPRGA